MTNTSPDIQDLSKAGIQAILTGIAVNAVLACVKILGGVAGNSYALVADGIESAADIASSLIVLGGLKIATIPPDKNHPYGHGKAEPLAALIISLFLAVAGVSIAIQSVRGIFTPHDVPEPYTLGILVVVVVVKETLFRFVRKRASRLDSRSLHADALHHRSDMFTSLAAFLGISMAIWGGEQYASADVWAALLASGIILANAIFLTRSTLNEVMDAAPPPEIEEAARVAALSEPGILMVEKCIVRKMGLNYYIDMHVSVEGSATILEGHAISHRAKDYIIAAQPAVSDVLIHIEPGKGND